MSAYSHKRAFSASNRNLELRDASIELVAQFLGIDRRANGDNLRAWRPLAPLVQFKDLGPASHCLQGETLVRGVRGENDALTPENFLYAPAEPYDPTNVGFGSKADLSACPEIGLLCGVERTSPLATPVNDLGRQPPQHRLGQKTGGAALH